MFAKKGKNTDSYDAVIIGAGPAGAAAARDLVLERFGAPPPEVFSRSGPIFWNHIA
jgi:thioredoxin reductase